MNDLRVLTYHRVADLDENSTLHPRLISATPAVFALQMQYLAKHYHVVSMEDVLEAAQKRDHLPPKAVLITFDDAYYDFGEIAWPILKSNGLTATVFVPTVYPDQPQLLFWWDRLYRSVISSSKTVVRSSVYGPLRFDTTKERLHSLNALQNYIKTLSNDEAMRAVDEICLELNDHHNGQRSTMSWEELRQLAKEGVSLGAHTQNHIILTQVSPQKVQEEIRGSLEDLKREIGNVLPIFSYPNGNYNNGIVQIAKDEGIRLAFGTKDGHNNLDRSDHLRLRRTTITRKTTPFIFALRLLRVFTYIDIWRHRNRN